MEKPHIIFMNTEDVIFFTIEFGKNYNIPIPMENKFYQELKYKFPKAYYVEASKVHQDEKLKYKFPKKYLRLKKDLVFIKIPKDSENHFIDFFNDFKKNHEKKHMKLKHKKHLVVFTLEIPFPIEQKFILGFLNNFSSDEFIGGIVKIHPKRQRAFEDFLKNFNK